MPNGHPVSIMLMAVAISFPANHSAVIFVKTSVRSTPPVPLTSLAATASPNTGLIAIADGANHVAGFGGPSN
jgi:hypothetical protein